MARFPLRRRRKALAPPALAVAAPPALAVLAALAVAARPTPPVLPARVKKLKRLSKRYAIALRTEAQRLNLLSRFIGYPVIVLAAVTSGALFAELLKRADWWRWIAGGVVLVAAVFAAVEKAGQFTERARAAGMLASEFGDVYGALVDLKDKVDRGQQPTDEILEATYKRYFDCAKHRPYLPAWVVRDADEQIDAEAAGRPPDRKKIPAFWRLFL